MKILVRIKRCLNLIAIQLGENMMIQNMMILAIIKFCKWISKSKMYYSLVDDSSEHKKSEGCE